MKYINSIANESNFTDLAKLRWEFKQKNTNYNIDFINHYYEYLKNEDKLGRLKVFISKSLKEIIGNINLVIIPKSPKPNSNMGYIGYITNTYVRPKFQNRGIGSSLLKNLTEHSKINQIELLFVWPSKKSIPFYERSNFKDNNDILENKF